MSSTTSRSAPLNNNADFMRNQRCCPQLPYSLLPTPWKQLVSEAGEVEHGEAEEDDVVEGQGDIADQEGEGGHPEGHVHVVGHDLVQAEHEEYQRVHDPDGGVPQKQLRQPAKPFALDPAVENPLDHGIVAQEAEQQRRLLVRAQHQRQ